MKKGSRTAAFSASLNGRGDFLSGIADMDVLSTIPKDHIDRFGIQNSKILLIDSNIGIKTLKYVLSLSTKVPHVIYEPISKEKASRILEAGCLNLITILKPNLLQLRDLAGLI